MIDAEGRPATVEAIVRALNGALTPQKCAEYLIINSGYGAIRLQHHNVHVWFRPEVVTDAALAELLYRIDWMQWRSAAALTFIGRDWLYQILPQDEAERLKRIGTIVWEAQSRADNAVLRRVRSLESIPSGSPVDRVLQAWLRNPDLPSSPALRRTLAEEIQGRYFWVDAYRSSSELIMAEVGDGFPKPVRAALMPGLGHRLQDQPDLAYGRYCANAYGAVAKSGLPTIEDVDALMTPPNGLQVRRRYSRLILPFRAANGNTRLLGISFENLAIDLRRAS